MITSAAFHRPELLAPGGDLQALQTAVRNGADAVYFGLDRFSARSQAHNLTLEQLPEAMRFLHEHAARGYLALNTLMRNDELPAALELANSAYELGIDAIIVQDIGLATLLRRNLPDLALHGSTQMSLSSEQDLRLAHDIGLSRVVLPRELSGAELQHLTTQAEALQIETEAFIHGALCICYSGQCLMSSLIGGRSGNRGACAQPCRLDYRLGRQQGALYSPRDQALLAHLPAIVTTPLNSLKIEGRMRGAAYVGQVAAVYRHALDTLELMHRSGKSGDEIAQIWPSLIQDDLARLLQAFNRGGSFTSAYWQGDTFSKLAVGGIPGSYGVRSGAIIRLDAHRGAFWIDGSHQLNAGDVLSVRRAQAEGQALTIASAPVGICQADALGMMVKGFHPDVLRDLQIGDEVFRMTDAAAEQTALRADDRKTLITINLDASSLTATVCQGPFAGRQARIDFVPDPLLNPLLHERATQQLKKTGGTAYQVESVNVDGPVQLTISQLNQLRRDLLVQMSDHLAGKRKLPTVMQSGQTEHCRLSSPSDLTDQSALADQPRPQVAAFFHQLPQSESDIPCGADLYELPLLALDEARIASIAQLIKAAEPTAKIVIHWPPMVTGAKSAVLPDLLAQAKHWPIDGVATAWPAYWDASPDKHLKKTGTRQTIRIAETTANLFNTESLLTALHSGAETLCPSLELNGEQLRDAIEQLGNRLLTEQPANPLAADPKSNSALGPYYIERPLYGRLRLMSTAYCPVGKNSPGCRICVRSTAPDDSRTYMLTDRKNQEFRVLPHPRTCQADLLNCDLLAVPDEFLLLKAALPANSGWRSRLYFCDETPDERRQLIKASRSLLEADPEDLAKSAEIWLNEAKTIAKRLDSRLTTGHFQRGVQ